MGESWNQSVQLKCERMTLSWNNRQGALRQEVIWLINMQTDASRRAEGVARGRGLQPGAEAGWEPTSWLLPPWGPALFFSNEARLGKAQPHGGKKGNRGQVSGSGQLSPGLWPWTLASPVEMGLTRPASPPHWVIWYLRVGRMRSMLQHFVDHLRKVWPSSLPSQDLNSTQAETFTPTSVWTCASLAVEVPSLHHWIARELSLASFFGEHFPPQKNRFQFLRANSSVPKFSPLVFWCHLDTGSQTGVILSPREHCLDTFCGVIIGG